MVLLLIFIAYGIVGIIWLIRMLADIIDEGDYFDDHNVLELIGLIFFTIFLWPIYLIRRLMD